MDSVRIRARDQLSLFAGLFQCRTGNAFAGEYLREIAPERSAASTCGVPHDPILVGWPELERFRDPLFALSPQLDVAALLGTPGVFRPELQ